MDVVCGRLFEKPGHLAPDRLAVVTTVDVIPWRLPAPVSPVSKPEPQFGLLSPVRGSLRPHPSKGTGQSWVLMPSTPASSRSASMLVPSLSFLLCFFSWVIYFSERKECGEFTTGLAFIFFFSAAQQPLLYEGSSRHRWQSGGGRGSWLTVGLRGAGYITTQRLKADPEVHVAQGRASKLPGSWEMLTGSLHANWTPGKPAVIFFSISGFFSSSCFGPWG